MQGVNKRKNKVPHKIDVEVGKRLKHLREMRGVSQTKLGNAMNITFQQIQKYETAQNRITSGRMRQISDFLEAPISYFFGQENSEFHNIDSLVINFLKTEEGFALNSAFSSIKSQNIKTKIVSLLNILAATSQVDTENYQIHMSEKISN